MKVTWLGQAGLFFDNGKQTVMIDPYLSDSVEKVEPKNYRRVPIDARALALSPDVMIFTHDHLDHYDPETAPHFFGKTEKPMTVLAPTSVWQKARKHGGGHNYVQFNRGTEWTEGELRFTAVYAEHSEPYAIGVIIEALSENQRYYVTGDTLFSHKIFPELLDDIDVMFLPINGVGNNMNMKDAARFAKRVGAKKVVPIHFGMFDSIDPSAFEGENRVLLRLYEEMIL